MKAVFDSHVEDVQGNCVQKHCLLSSFLLSQTNMRSGELQTTLLQQLLTVEGAVLPRKSIP